MQMVIKLLRRLIEGHLRFLEIIENTDARAHTS